MTRTKQPLAGPNQTSAGYAAAWPAQCTTELGPPDRIPLSCGLQLCMLQIWSGPGRLTAVTATASSQEQDAAQTLSSVILLAAGSVPVCVRGVLMACMGLVG